MARPALQAAGQPGTQSGRAWTLEGQGGGTAGRTRTEAGPGLHPAAAAAGEGVEEDPCDAPDGGGGTEEEEGRVAAGRPCGQGTAEAAPQSPAGPPASESRCRCYLPYIQTQIWGDVRSLYVQLTSVGAVAQALTRLLFF